MMMKTAGGDAAFAPAPLPLPPRGRCRVAKRCFLALASWPWLTLIAVVPAAVGISMFDERMRDALNAAETASTIVDGSGLREWTAVARSCVTAATVVRRGTRRARTQPVRRFAAPAVAARKRGL